MSQNTSEIKREPSASTYMLETRELGISFGGLRAAENVNLKIKKNELYGLIGPNGAGKTTVFNMLTGVYAPTTGTFHLDGENLTGLTEEQINRRGIARTFQNIRLFNNMSVIRNVLVGLHNAPEFKCKPLHSIFRTAHHFENEKRMRDRAKEILSIFGLLEEPAAGMNPQETAELVETIRFVQKTFDMTVLLIEHDMSLVSTVCDRVTVLNFGQVLAEGPVSEVLKLPEVVRAYLGDD